MHTNNPHICPLYWRSLNSPHGDTRTEWKASILTRMLLLFSVERASFFQVGSMLALKSPQNEDGEVAPDVFEASFNLGVIVVICVQIPPAYVFMHF